MSSLRVRDCESPEDGEKGSTLREGKVKGNPRVPSRVRKIYSYHQFDATGL